MKESDWKIIDTLYQIPNITQAAEALYMTQPTMSKRLQQIEQELGVKLVLRYSKGVIFTPEGKYVAGEAHKLLLQFEDIWKNLLRIGDGESGTIQLGMTNAFARFTIAPFLKQYKQLYPKINFDISTDVSAGVTEMLERHQIHVGFIRGDFVKSFEKSLLAVEQACLASKTKVDLSELPSMPQIHYLADPFAQKLLDRWWYDHFSVPPLIGMHANHGDTCREMILSGLGYSIFLSPNFIGNDGNLYKMPLFYKDGSPFTRNCWMIWQKELYEIPLIGNFIDYIRENFAKENSGL